MRIFKDRTNISPVGLVPQTKDFQSQEMPSIIIPFEVVVNVLPVANDSCCGEDAVIRRSDRYNQAELALKISLQRSSEQESTASQLRALRRILYLLHLRSSEAADNLEKLRALLLDRSLEPREYQCNQRQRWLEERSLFAVEELSDILQRSLKTVSTRSVSPSNEKSNANLRRFLVHPRSQVPVGRRKHYQHLWGDNGFPRVHRHTSLLPLTLSSQRRLQRTPSPTRRRYSSNSIHDVIVHPSPTITRSSLTDSSTRETTPFPEMFPRSTTPLSSAACLETGTATIWQQTAPFPREEILNGLVVSVPDYVNDLLADFDFAISVAPTLRLSKPINLKSESRDRLPGPGPWTTSSFSSGTDFYSTPPPKRRNSVLFDVVASHLTPKSRDEEMSSRAARRRSSPPSAFPSALSRDSIGPSGRTTRRRTSISISDLRSVFSGSGSFNDPIATSTPKGSVSGSQLQPEEQPQQRGTDEKLLKRLRRRMSFLRRF